MTNLILRPQPEVIEVANLDPELCEILDKNFIGYSIDNSNVFVYTRIQADERKARSILREWGFTLKLYLPGDRSIDKDTEWIVIVK